MFTGTRAGRIAALVLFACLYIGAGAASYRLVERHLAPSRPIAMIVLYECNTLQGAIVVTADGKSHEVDDPATIRAFGKALPNTSMSARVSSNCIRT
jgi:hypothetical protein